MEDHCLDQLICCPLSGNSLRRDKDCWIDDKQHSYPVFDHIPWLLPNPQHSLVDWQVKISFLVEQFGKQSEQLIADSKSQSGPTQARLTQLAQGKQAFARQLIEITQPLFQTPPSQALLQAVLPDQAPRLQNVLSYESNIYRDWVWGESENQKACETVLSTLPKKSYARLFMPGAGAGKLLHDLHSALTPSISVGADINPFLLLSAARLLRGQSITLTEFPQEPVDLSAVAIEQTLKAPESPLNNVALVFADLLRPAFLPASFDLVVTPWLIDILPAKLGDTLSALNHYLPVGGSWVNFGSLVFHHRDQTLCYTMAEISELAQHYGFEITDHRNEQVPYLHSPHNAGYRMERIWVWHAVKTHDVPLSRPPQPLPDWFYDTSLPVPAHPYFAQLSRYNSLSGETLSWANGQISLNKMASRLAKKHKIDKTEAKKMLVQLYRQIVEQMQTRRY